MSWTHKSRVSGQFTAHVDITHPWRAHLISGIDQACPIYYFFWGGGGLMPCFGARVPQTAWLNSSPVACRTQPDFPTTWTATFRKCACGPMIVMLMSQSRASYGGSVSTNLRGIYIVVVFVWGGGGGGGAIFLYGFFLIRIFAYVTFVHILMDLLPEMYQKTWETLRNTIFRSCGARI